MDIRNLSKLILMAIAVLLLAGCMAAAQHKDRMDKAHLIGKEQGILSEIQEMEKDVLTDPDEAGERHIDQGTDIITLMELGALYHYAGMYQRSNEALEIVYAHYADKEMLTDINLRNIGSNLVKGAFSEALGGAYELVPYEKVYLHTLKALNYLLLNEPESAMVEVRRAEHQQAKIEDELAKQKAEAEEKKAKNSEKFAAVNQNDYDKAESEFMKQAALTDEEKALISGLKDGYRNAMTYNLSSIVYELERIIDGDAALDDAALDLRKSLELYDNPGVAERYTHWAVYRGRTKTADDQPVFRSVKRAYPKMVKAAYRKPDLMNNVHVFLHTGDSPRVEALDIRFPNPISKTLSKVSIPRYKPIPDQTYRLVVKGNRQTNYSGKQLDFDALAMKAYDDKLPGIYLRAITRMVVNTAVDKEMEKRAGWIGQLTAAIKNEMLEQADTRSWTSLPKVIDYGTSHVSGDSINVAVLGTSGRQLFSQDYAIEPGKVLLVDIRKLGDDFLDHHAYLSGGPELRLARNKAGNSRQNTIRTLQMRLNALGFNAGVADGVPGQQTKTAIESFQRAHGQTPTGDMNDIVINSVNEAYKDMVRKIQGRLQQLGYDPGPADGVPGGKTRSAIEGYQKSVGVNQDGQVSKSLLESLVEI
jgi:hypothetical protein